MATEYSTPESDTRLADIQKREQRATEGPWEVTGKSYQIRNPGERWYVGTFGSEDENLRRLIWAPKPTGFMKTNYDNAHFTANAREDIPWLLGYIEALNVLKDTQGDQIDKLKPYKKFHDHIEGHLDTHEKLAGPGHIGVICKICKKPASVIMNEDHDPPEGLESMDRKVN